MTLNYAGAKGADHQCSQESKYNLSQPSAYRDSQQWTEKTSDPWTSQLKLCGSIFMHISGPMQFKLQLFKGPLYSWGKLRDE